MNRVLNWLLTPYTREEDRSAAHLLSVIVLAAIVGSLAIAVATYFNDDPLSSIALAITAAILTAGLLLLRAGGLGFNRWFVPLVAFLLVSYEVYAIGDGTKEVQILGYSVVILFATLLLGPRGAWIFTFLSSASYTAILFTLQYELLRPYEGAGELQPLDAVVATLIFGLVAVIQITIVNRLSASLARLRENEAELRSTIQTLVTMQDNLELLVAERTAQIEASAEVGRAASSILDQDELITRTVNLITERFGYYYAAIFLVDEHGIWANLQHATGEAGRTLLERRHRLQVGGRSIVGAAIANGSAQVALDAGAEAVRFDNPLLPETRSEIALPLMVGSRALGALDVQSTKGNAFDAEETEMLQSMADQVAVAIENARLFQESQARLAELNRLYRRDVTVPAASLRFQDGQISSAGSLDPDALQRARAEKGLAVRQDGDRTEVLVPLMTGGKVIGVMQLTSKDRRWSSEELAMLESAANQVSITLENAILVEASQERARQERALTEGTGRIRETLDIEAILQTAAAEMRRTLNLLEVEVQVGLAPGAPPENGQ